MNLKITCFTSSENAGDTSCMRCTICSQQLFLVSPANIRFHPVLAVLICKVGAIHKTSPLPLPVDATQWRVCAYVCRAAWISTIVVNFPKTSPVTTSTAAGAPRVVR